MLKLPTFEAGQRVVIYNRPIEWFCSGCGRRLLEDWAGEYYVATVLPDDPDEAFGCRYCGTIEGTSGWIKVQLDGCMQITWAPYPLVRVLVEAVFGSEND